MSNPMFLSKGKPNGFSSRGTLASLWPQILKKEIVNNLEIAQINLFFCCDCLTCVRCRQFPRLHLARHRWQSQWVHNGNPHFQTATTWQQSILFSQRPGNKIFQTATTWQQSFSSIFNLTAAREGCGEIHTKSDVHCLISHSRLTWYACFCAFE